MLGAVVFSFLYVSVVWSHLLSISQEFLRICLGIDPFLVSQGYHEFLYLLLLSSMYLINLHNDSKMEGVTITLFFRKLSLDRLTSLKGHSLTLGPWFMKLPTVYKYSLHLSKTFSVFASWFPPACDQRAPWGPSLCPLQHLHSADSTKYQEHRSTATCPRSHNYEVAGQDLNPESQAWRLAPKTTFYSDLRCHSPSSSQQPPSERKAYH